MTDFEVLESQLSELDQAIATTATRLEMLSQTAVTPRSSTPEDVIDAALGAAEFQEMQRIERQGLSEALATLREQRVTAQEALDEAKEESRIKAIRYQGDRAIKALEPFTDRIDEAVANLQAILIELEAVASEHAPAYAERLRTLKLKTTWGGPQFGALINWGGVEKFAFPKLTPALKKHDSSQNGYDLGLIEVSATPLADEAAKKARLETHRKRLEAQRQREAEKAARQEAERPAIEAADAAQRAVFESIRESQIGVTYGRR